MPIFLALAILTALSINATFAEEYDGNLTSPEPDNFTSIQNQIDNAEDGSIIYLKNSNYNGNGSSITINKNITIRGYENTVLDAQSKSNIFTVNNNANVVIEKLSLTNGKGNDGGAILNNGNLMLKNLKIIENKATTGGAIYNNGILSIYDTALNKNSATYCGGIYNTNKLTLSNVEANLNKAERESGVIYNEGDLNISNSKFNKNNAEEGSVIYAYGTLMINNCEFINNEVKYSYGIIKIILANFKIQNSLFKDNSGSDEGGCIFNLNGIGNIENTKFISNQARSHGGAIDNNGNLKINNCEFKDNYAYGAGAIDNEGNLIIANSKFVGNSARTNGGAIDTTGLMNITKTLFEKNSADNEGGAIIARGATNITSSSFIQNAGGFADAIYLNDINYTINNNWWGSNNPDFKKLLNEIPNDLTWTIIRSKISCYSITKQFNSNRNNLIITLKDSLGNAVTNSKITIKINNNKWVKTTNSKGQIQLNIKLVPNKYTAAITYTGNAQITGSSNSCKLIITKATPTLLAYKKTFKSKTKIKKYTVTLKDNNGNYLKKAKVTLKIKGRTYKAFTNYKGKATFKITKLNKKGKYFPIIKFKENSYYKSVSKRVKITVKK